MECCGNSNPSSTGSSSSTKKKKNKGVVKLSTDPQSVAARERRHRISDRFKILQSMVPGGSKLDTVSMLEEAIHYVKFLKTQIWLHETMINFVDDDDDPAALFLPYQPPLCSSQNNLVVDAVQPLPTVSCDETILSYGDAALKY